MIGPPMHTCFVRKKKSKTGKLVNGYVVMVRIVPCTQLREDSEEKILDTWFVELPVNLIVLPKCCVCVVAGVVVVCVSRWEVGGWIP